MTINDSIEKAVNSRFISLELTAFICISKKIRIYNERLKTFV